MRYTYTSKVDVQAALRVMADIYARMPVGVRQRAEQLYNDCPNVWMFLNALRSEADESKFDFKLDSSLKK
jgi:hypothetical protein